MTTLLPTEHPFDFPVTMPANVLKREKTTLRNANMITRSIENYVLEHVYCHYIV